MTKQQIRAHCRQCKHEQLFERIRVNHPLHALLTIVTLGFWGISWISLMIGAWFRPWRCHHCGWHDPEFRIADIPAPGTPRWPAEEPRGRRRVDRRPGPDEQGGTGTALLAFIIGLIELL